MYRFLSSGQADTSCWLSVYEGSTCNLASMSVFEGIISNLSLFRDEVMLTSKVVTRGVTLCLTSKPRRAHHSFLRKVPDEDPT